VRNLVWAQRFDNSEDDDEEVDRHTDSLLEQGGEEAVDGGEDISAMLRSLGRSYRSR